jgi:hypothetical protein
VWTGVQVELCLILILTTTAALDGVLDVLEALIEGRVWRTLERVYRELMVLGLTSSALWIGPIVVGTVEDKYYKVGLLALMVKSDSVPYIYA